MPVVQYDFNMTDKTAFELAGMNADGRKVRTGELRVSRSAWVDAKRDRLYYSLKNEGAKPGTIRRNASPAMLSEFIELADSAPERIEAFARKHGAFGLCRHGLPYSHTATAPKPCQRREDRYGCWEPLSAWRNAALKFRAVMRLAASQHQGSKGAADDWQAAFGVELPKPRSKRATFIAAYVTSQLVYGQVMPLVTWKPGGFAVEFHALGLPNAFGHLTLQLAVAIARTEGLAVCSSCGVTYAPTKRKPAAGRRSYCPACFRDGAPQRDASADYRRRKRKQPQRL